MADYVVRDTQLTSVADAIRAKGGTSAPLAFPDGFVDAVEAIPTGGWGGSVPAKEVNFRDYDGTVVYAYTRTEFAALTAMPDNPDHSGDEIPLTSQGWNWSFEDAQAYVAKYGRLEVGQMYTTADDKTHVLIHLEKGRTSPILGCCPNGTVDVDWGDGTAHDTLTGTSVTSVKWTPRHEYAAPGDYDIKLTCTGTMGFYGESASNCGSALLRHSVSADTRNVTYENAIQNVRNSSNVTRINTAAFQYCYSLAFINIPKSVTNISDYAFRYCYSLMFIGIPDSVTSVAGTMLAFCSSLMFTSLPDNVTSIDDSALYACYGLFSIAIPDNVTSIGGNALYACFSLTSVVIPDSVMSIGYKAFCNCYGLGEIHFTSTTPPTVSASNVFQNLQTDCKIYVPAGTLAAYTSATNYPSSSTYTYLEE